MNRIEALKAIAALPLEVKRRLSGIITLPVVGHVESGDLSLMAMASASGALDDASTLDDLLGCISDGLCLVRGEVVTGPELIGIIQEFERELEELEGVD